MISVPITIEQLILAVQNLQPEDRVRIAQALVQSELSSDLTALIQELYADDPADDVSDEEILSEIKAVRTGSLSL